MNNWKIFGFNIGSIIDFIIRFLLRRRDYLSRGIYAIILAMLRELSAIGFSEGILDLAREIKQNPLVQGWKYWGIRILEVTLAGGSWVILIVLSFLLAFTAFLKYKTKDSPSNKHSFNSQLRSIEKLIADFKSQTAIELLRKFMQDLEDSYILKQK